MKKVKAPKLPDWLSIPNDYVRIERDFQDSYTFHMTAGRAVKFSREVKDWEVVIVLTIDGLTIHTYHFESLHLLTLGKKLWEKFGDAEYQDRTNRIAGIKQYSIQNGFE